MNASSLIKSGLFAVAVAVASPSFSATVIPLAPTGTGGLSGIFGGIHSTSGAFTDNFTFSVGSAVGVVGASAIEFVIDGGNYLDLTSLTLNGVSVDFTKVGNLYTASTTTSVIPDPQTLSITGSAINGGGSYGGQVTFNSAVPEVATWGMMLVGFGAMGGALRSNRRRAGAFA